MSENLDLVRSIFADWERGDHSCAEWADPEVELVIVDGPNPGTWTGLAAVTKAWGEFISGCEEVRTLADEYRSLDDERVLVATQFSARGGGSGLALTGKGAILFHIREGKVTRIVRYWEPDRALSDLGLAG
jgi:ketosteroid isomerase-like protein